MHLCIYEADRPGEEAAARFGTYADMIAGWLGPALPEARFARVFVAAGEAPPPPGAFDGVLITGSRSGVHDAEDWIAGLIGHLRDLRRAAVPVAGICFGHQAMALAYGGRVARAPAGWTIGRHDHAPTAAGADRFGAAALPLLSFHQDQVVALPPGAEVLIGSPQSPIGALAYPFPALSVQTHPEFGPGYVGHLLDRGIGVPLPAPTVATARAGLAGPLAGDIVADAFARFFRARSGAAA